MTLLRILLFAGLVAHKAVWEVMKRSSKGVAAPKPERAPRSAAVMAVKTIKALVLLFLLVQTLFLNVLPIVDEPYAIRIVGTAIYAVGLLTAITGRLQLGENWLDFEDYDVMKGQALVAEGVYRYIRHPIYTGDIFLLLGLELALNSWLVLGVPVLFFIVRRQAAAEETLLAKSIRGYDDYCKRTKRFIPFVI